MEVIQIYTVVEAKSVNELVKLTNIKTKQGWNCLGGMCNTPMNFSESDSQTYGYCQSMFRMEKLKNGKGDFVAFPKNTSKKTTKKKNAPKN